VNKDGYGSPNQAKELAVNRSAINLILLVFVLLMVGLYFMANGFNLPMVRQTTNEAASAIDMTDDKAAMLALLVAFVTVNIVGIAVTLYIIMWLLNRNVAQANQQPNEPFQLLAGGSVDSAAASATIADNALFIMLGVGVAALGITLVALLVL
jgi:lysylphosphatidylglycerol synthetase-like protein (DUF2156 family)